MKYFVILFEFNYNILGKLCNTKELQARNLETQLFLKILGLRKFEEIWKLSNMKASTEKLNRKLIGNYY